MPSVNVVWEAPGRFVGAGSTGATVVMSAGNGGQTRGLMPSELLLIALGGCVAVDVVNILQKKRQSPTQLEILVEGEQAPEPPWTFRKIRLLFRLSGERLTADGVRSAISLAEGKYCPVSATLRPAVEIHADFEIRPEAKPADRGA